MTARHVPISGCRVQAVLHAPRHPAVALHGDGRSAAEWWSPRLHRRTALSASYCPLFRNLAVIYVHAASVVEPARFHAGKGASCHVIRDCGIAAPAITVPFDTPSSPPLACATGAGLRGRSQRARGAEFAVF
uniref:Uncharacterized protein n=1 Tax=Rhipicephalus zambeziensis TaxID=60191 RepID=A0A224YFN4_9ACAR